MPSTCAAIGCTSSYAKMNNPRGLARQFFRFPMNDPERLAKWVKAVRRKNWFPTNSSRLCSNHFTERDFTYNPNLGIRRLRKDAIPTRFNYPTQLSDHGSRSKLQTRSSRPDETRTMIIAGNSSIRSSTGFRPSLLRHSTGSLPPGRSPASAKHSPFSLMHTRSERERSSLMRPSPQLRHSPIRRTIKRVAEHITEEDEEMAEMKDYEEYGDESQAQLDDDDDDDMDDHDDDSQRKLDETNKDEEEAEASKDKEMGTGESDIPADAEALYRSLKKYKDTVPGLDVIIKMNRNLASENEALRKRLKDVESRLDFWSVEKIANDDVATRCYTGLPSYSAFLWLFNTLRVKVENMRLEEELLSESDEELAEKPDEPDTEELPHIDQLLLVMMRLKLGLLIQDLALRFGIQSYQARVIFTTWINAMESVFRSNYPLLPKNIMKLHIPFNFKNYPLTRILLGSVRIQVQYGFIISSKDCHKYPTRLKFLLGIMPNGVVCFVSKPFGEQSSESSMVESSGILKLLQPGDCAMGSNWPGVEEMFTKNGISYTPLPVSASEGKQDSKELEQFSSFIEERLRCLKKFSILSDTVPLSKTEKLGKIFTVCAFLINLVKAR